MTDLLSISVAMFAGLMMTRALKKITFAGCYCLSCGGSTDRTMPFGGAEGAGVGLQQL